MYTRLQHEPLLTLKCTKQDRFQPTPEQTPFAKWKEPADILANFPSTDLLGDDTSRAVFDISGNRYRRANRQIRIWGETSASFYLLNWFTHAVR